jgi:N-acetylglutamate synthase-like GNAT family acetyltransferase
LENIIEIDDSKIITEILNKAFMTVAQQYNFTKENAPAFPAFFDSDKVDNFLNNGLKMYGYKNDNKIIGCIGYSYYKDKIYLIERLATLPEYRHTGVGKKLMQFVENKIKYIGGKIAEIHVVDKNIVLREWYKKLNYVEIRIDEIKTLPFNYNVCVMNKELT